MALTASHKATSRIPDGALEEEKYKPVKTEHVTRQKGTVMQEKALVFMPGRVDAVDAHAERCHCTHTYE